MSPMLVHVARQCKVTCWVGLPKTVAVMSKSSHMVCRVTK